MGNTVDENTKLAAALGRSVDRMSVTELSHILQKHGKVVLTRSRGGWVLLLDQNEYKGKTVLEVLCKSLWD